MQHSGILLLEGQNLTANLPGHADPVQQSEHDKQRDHIAAQLIEHRVVVDHRAKGHLHDGGQQNDHQGVGQGVDDIHQSHDEHIHLAAAVARDGAHGNADNQHDQAGEEAHAQRDPGAVAALAITTLSPISQLCATCT